MILLLPILFTSVAFADGNPSVASSSSSHSSASSSSSSKTCYTNSASPTPFVVNSINVPGKKFIFAEPRDGSGLYTDGHSRDDANGHSKDDANGNSNNNIGVSSGGVSSDGNGNSKDDANGHSKDDHVKTTGTANDGGTNVSSNSSDTSSSSSSGGEYTVTACSSKTLGSTINTSGTNTPQNQTATVTQKRAIYVIVKP